MAITAAGMVLLIATWAVAAAQAKTEVFKVAYAGYGQFENVSQIDDDAGCRRKEDWVGHYSFRQDWKVRATVTPHRIAIYRQAQYAGAPGLPQYPTSLEVQGSQVRQPREDCEWAGGPNDTGTYQCGDDKSELLLDHDLHLADLRGSPRILFTAPAFVGYNPTLTGKVSVPSLRSIGCSAFSFSDGIYAVGPDIAVRIPVKPATLYHLKLGHYFRVNTRLGHYTFRPSQVGHSCLGLSLGRPDFCTVTSEKYQGELLLKRVQ